MEHTSALNMDHYFYLAGLAVSGLIWLVRLEAKTNSNKEKNFDNWKAIEKVEVKVEKMEVRHDEVYDEVRLMLLGIQKSISNIEGRLYINPHHKGE